MAVPSMAHFKAKRTQALPDRSLFGTTLDYDTNLKKAPTPELDQIGADLLQPNTKWKERMQVTVPFATTVNDQKNLATLSLKQNNVRQLAGDIRGLREQALYFRPEQVLELQNIRKNLTKAAVREEREKEEQASTTSIGRYFADIKPSYRDLEHSDAVNNVGIGNTGQYDWHRQGPKRAKVAPYKVIGDVFHTGNFTTSRHVDRGHDMPSQLKAAQIRTSDLSMLEKSKKQTVVESRVPANIRHTYGAKITKEAMQDEELKSKVLRERRKKTPRHTALPPLRNDVTDPVYQDLSNVIRLDVLPGAPYHTKSEVASHFTADVHKNAQRDEDYLKYGRKTDYLGKWCQDNVYRENVMKAFDKWIQEKAAKKP
ncbi:TEX33 [Branchiostoma lanceolatum]|uniref:TEX33 protein n=1 Tax=Branchiostoma lanceolatum TaxID=7740 RepID=A0A8K0ABK7_BRALA|nr:TEX33 [Branchiostoma lanceolatum]